MEKPDEIKVYLKITGFRCSPKDISDSLGFKADKTWLKGDLNVPGAIIRRKENGWMFQCKLSPNAEFKEQIENILSIILPKKERFKKLPQDCDIAIYCVVYSVHGRPDISLTSELVQNIAEINAALEYDLFRIPSD